MKKSLIIFTASFLIISLLFCSAGAFGSWKHERKVGLDNQWGVEVEKAHRHASGHDTLFIKKALCIILAVVLVVVCASFASAGWKFDRKVKIICPWPAGGSSDETVRTMAKLLNSIINQEVEVLNVVGDDGTKAIEFANSQPADGYTFLLGTQSLFMQDIQGTTDIKFKNEFIPVVRLVHAINILTISNETIRETGYKNFSDLSEYMLKNPYEISVGMLTSTGLDGVAIRQTLECLDVLKVTYHTAGDLASALVEGHIDLMIGGIEEISDLVEDDEVTPILSLSEKRLKKYPDVQCTGELGIDSFMGPARGLFAKKETPKEAIDAMVEAVRKASKTPIWKKFLEQGCYDERPGFADQNEYIKLCEEDYKLLTEYLTSEGLLKTNYFKDDGNNA